jgi:hypothetical protein
MIDFTCPHCDRRLTAKESLIGRNAKCVQCGETVQVPGEEIEVPDVRLPWRGVALRWAVLGLWLLVAFAAGAGGGFIASDRTGKARNARELAEAKALAESSAQALQTTKTVIEGVAFQRDKAAAERDQAKEKLAALARERDARAAQEQSAPQPATVRDWRDVAADELAVAQRRRDELNLTGPYAEPLPKAGTMTETEYRQAKALGEEWRTQIALDTLEVKAVVLRRLPTEKGAWVRVIMPRTVDCWEREALCHYLDATATDRGFEMMVRHFPLLRVLGDEGVRGRLKARLPSEQRRNLYAEFAKLTNDARRWPLTHPFDDLSGEEMQAMVAAASTCQAKGLGALAREDRHRLLVAGALDFFEKYLQKAR